MQYTLRRAAAATGRHRSSLLRCIQEGKLSATRDEVSGAWLIEAAELHRLFPQSADAQTDAGHSAVPGREQDGSHKAVQTAENGGGHSPVRNAAALVEVRELRARLADKDEQLADLRRRLDQADTDRRQALDRLAAAQERIAALLTDQRTAPPAPARRSWWQWGRRA